MTMNDRAPGPTSVEPAVDFAGRLILAVGARQPVGLLVTQRDAQVADNARRAALKLAVAECHEAAAKYHMAGLYDCEQIADALADDIDALAAAPRDPADGG